MVIRVQLRYLPVRTNAKIDEDRLVIVEALQCTAEKRKGVGRVNGIARQVQEVEKSANRANEAGRRHAARKRQPDHQGKEKATDVGMLLAGHLLQGGDSFQEEPDMMVGWQPATASIKFLRTVCLLEPAQDVLDDTLIELVEDVGREKFMNVGTWKVVCEGLIGVAAAHYFMKLTSSVG